MRIFKKAVEQKNIPTDALAQRIAGNILGRQKMIATYLNNTTKNLTGKTLLLGLIGFCAVFGFYCIYLFISAIKLI